MSHTSRQGSRQSKGTSAGSETSRSPRRSPNKIYRTPPTPPPEQLYRLERSFTLDCIAVDTTSKDYAKVNPKLGQVTRPYNGQKDRSARDYFRFQGVDRTITRNGQVSLCLHPATSTPFGSKSICLSDTVIYNHRGHLIGMFLVQAPEMNPFLL